MLPVSAKDIITFVPSSEKDKENPATYYLAVPTYLTRAKYRRDLFEQGVDCPSNTELFAAFRDGVRALMPPDEQAGLLALADDIEAARGKAPEELRRRYGAVEIKLSEAHAPLRKLLAQRIWFMNMYPFIAFRHFVKGGERLPAPLEVRNGLVTEQTLNALPEDHIFDVSDKIISLINLTPDQEKNSDSPSSSPASATTSATA